MWPFNPRVDPGCPSGSVHAWEYNGQLYKSEVSRDVAERQNKIRIARSCIEDYLRFGQEIVPSNGRNKDGSKVQAHRAFADGSVDPIEYHTQCKYSDKVLTIGSLTNLLTKDTHLMGLLVEFNKQKCI